MDEPNIYNMNLFDKLSIDKIYILRVPGGWIFKSDYVNGFSGVFVPLNSEFKGNQRMGL